MKATEFCYWLQGYFELTANTGQGMSEAQVKVIRQHLDMVFIHDIDPSYPKEQQSALSHAHKPEKPIPRC